MPRQCEAQDETYDRIDNTLRMLLALVSALHLMELPAAFPTKSANPEGVITSRNTTIFEKCIAGSYRRTFGGIILHDTLRR